MPAGWLRRARWWYLRRRGWSFIAPPADAETMQTCIVYDDETGRLLYRSRPSNLAVELWWQRSWQRRVAVAVWAVLRALLDLVPVAAALLLLMALLANLPAGG